ncbi:MAG: GDSL-type esterase/lipase family protein [Spirochaetia bacterium]|jgi:lysophospholipase L1-like esterase|nr:GDSL-type esterase/lipase family protein [Spirochaetia bacterium]
MLGQLLIPIILLFVVVSISASLVASVNRHSRVLPHNAPEAWVKAHGLPVDEPPRSRPIVVCAGDSLTHGILSANYVDMLATRLPEVEFVNAGINSELAYNLHARLDQIIALKPDFISILIGSNDVNATFGLAKALNYLATQRPPQVPTPQFYHEMLVLIVRRLKAETRAHIALCSIPPIGEDPGHYAWIRTEEYAAIVKKTAFDEGVEYLPLRERMCAYLADAPPKKAIAFENFRRAGLGAVWDHKVLGMDWDEIAARNGFHLLVDGLHLNSHGAGMIASLVERFIRDGRRAEPAPAQA